jgi:anti-anti-sigma factor
MQQISNAGLPRSGVIPDSSEVGARGRCASHRICVTLTLRLSSQPVDAPGSISQFSAFITDLDDWLQPSFRFDRGVRAHTLHPRSKRDPLMIAPFSANAATRGFTSHSGGCTVYCNGTQMRAHCRDQVTVVRITGDIDASNIDRFYDYTHRFVGEAPGLILDLSEVDFLCARGISVLITLDNDCRTAGTHWAIVGSPFVRRLLHIGDPSDALPTASSERQGLNTIAAQRQASLAAS